MHEFLRLAVGAQNHAHINTAAGRGMETASAATATAGLVVGDQNSAVCGALSGQFPRAGIGGIYGVKP